MGEPKSFAALGAGLLARKGAARPAMRPQGLHVFGDTHFGETMPQIWPDPALNDDLGWNDMGEAASAPVETPAALPVADIVPVMPLPVPADAPARRSALAEGRRAAFTLRVDSDRHLRLRLACTLSQRSAQSLLTAALDRLLADLPHVSALAAQVKPPR